jgi:hypothetical protein
MIVAFAMQAIAVAALLTTALDVYAHKRVEQVGGVNMWGYRGPTARVKRPNEIRIGLIGGTMAFGWGVAAEETMITSVRRLVSLAFDRPGGDPAYVTAVNLALTGLPHGAYLERLQKYSDLAIDVLCVYPDPVSLSQARMLVRRDSAIERLTGYTPILPVVLEEKGVPLVGGLWRRVDGLAYRVVVARDERGPVDPARAVLATVEHALTVTRGVVVVLPIAPGAEAEGIPGLAAQLASYFGGDARVRVVNAVAADDRLLDPGLRLDGESFGAGGNALVGEAASPAVIELLRDTSSS